MNKQQLMDAVLTEEERKCVDTAYPQEWADKVRDLGLNPEHIVWCYAKSRIFGEPIDLAHRFLQKYQDLQNTAMDSVDEGYVNAVISANDLIMKQLGV